MSMKGWIVRWVGHQVNWPVTSCSGLSDEVIITYRGTATNRPSTTTVTVRKVFIPTESRIFVPPISDEEIDAGDEQQEQQQEYRHRRAEPEVQVDEGRVVDVDRDQVTGRWLI